VLKEEKLLNECQTKKGRKERDKEERETKRYRNDTERDITEKV
jgi:hypothetical protein